LGGRDDRFDEPSRLEVERELARLRAAVTLHERTIRRQEAELAELRARVGAVVPAPAAGGAGRRPSFPLVPGSDYTIVFDGGADPNPGRGYGSYQIVGAEGVVVHREVELGERVTNNQAEYRTLILALEELVERLGGEAARTVVAVRGDSDLLIKQLTGQWKVKHPEIRPLHAQAVGLLGGFRWTDVAWHGRHNSVRVLGH